MHTFGCPHNNSDNISKILHWLKNKISWRLLLWLANRFRWTCNFCMFSSVYDDKKKPLLPGAIKNKIPEKLLLYCKDFRVFQFGLRYSKEEDARRVNKNQIFCLEYSLIKHFLNIFAIFEKCFHSKCSSCHVWNYSLLVKTMMCMSKPCGDYFMILDRVAIFKQFYCHKILKSMDVFKEIISMQIRNAMVVYKTLTFMLILMY